jgi:hypothetical protein
MRDTLARLISQLMRPFEQPVASAQLPVEVNGHAYINGHTEPALPPPSVREITVEAEPVSDRDRYDPSRGDNRDKARREASWLKPQTKDDARN